MQSGNEEDSELEEGLLSRDLRQIQREIASGHSLTKTTTYSYHIFYIHVYVYTYILSATNAKRKRYIDDRKHRQRNHVPTFIYHGKLISWLILKEIHCLKLYFLFYHLRIIRYLIVWI